MTEELMFAAVLTLSGFGMGALSFWFYHKMKFGDFKKLAEEIVRKSEQEAQAIREKTDLQLKQRQLEKELEMEETWGQERKKLGREEERLKRREDKLETRLLTLEKKESESAKREAQMQQLLKEFDKEKQKTLSLKALFQQNLEKLSGLTQSEAKDLLLHEIRDEVRGESANFIRKSKLEAEEIANKRAQNIIAGAINRLSVSCVSEATITTVSIQNDELKGRIIGREGRNIRCFEMATGVNVLIDDTPGVVILSGFDPVRKEIAKIALTDLIADGRIHPTTIEEAVERAKIEVQDQIKEFGEDAALRLGVISLHPELITLLGKLHFCFSFGQNVLNHSIEVSRLLGLMATELGLDVRLAKRIGLLHDIGKAAAHEMDGTHALIGHDLALKFGESKEVANGIGCHHGEIDATTIEASLCSAADAISASRPGARIESVDEYIKRLKRLEELAYEFPGVDKVYALQAGREVRVIVLPEMIDDEGVVTLARDLTKRVEQDLKYPGKIKVTVIREKRIVEYAS